LGVARAMPKQSREETKQNNLDWSFDVLLTF
jgi:hypothetical protein